MYYPKATERQVRSRILQKADKVRIKKNGEVHAYGPIPNATHMTRWYFAGFLENLCDELGYEMWMTRRLPKDEMEG